MDTLTKAVVLLWRYNRLLEEEYGDISREVDALGDLVLRYLREAKINEKQHPETTAALFKVLRSAESSASNMDSLHQEKVKLHDAIMKIYMDLAIDPTSTLQ